MNFKEHTTPENLEKYSFLWSEARLLIAALALFIGGYPPATYFAPYALYNLMSSLVHIAWLVSGAATIYLLYEWNKRKTLFGGTDKRDLYAFGVMSVSGLNLGLTGLLGNNLGMSISSSRVVFVVVGVLYVIAAYHLYTRWKSHGERVF